VLVTSVIRKILVFVLQMEKSKQSTCIGWGRTALLKKGESPVLPFWGKGRRSRGHGGCRWSLLAFKTYTTPWARKPRRFPPIVNEWGGPWAIPTQVRGVWAIIPRQHTWAPNFSTSSLPQTPHKRQYSKKFFFGGVAEEGGPSSVAALSWQGTIAPTYKGKLSLLFLSLGAH
jgi:hypothetical protein